MRKVRLLACGFGLVLLTVAAGAAHAKGVSPNDAEQQALAALKGKLTGLIVWESNRTDAWELYVMNADGTGARQLTHLGEVTNSAYSTYLRPRLSPDGKTILFAYGKHDAAAETWVVSLKGDDPRKLCDGLPLNWSADGTSVYLLRDSLVRSYDVATGDEAVVSEVGAPADGKNGDEVGTLHPSLRSVIIRNEYVPFAEGKVVKTMAGCEARFTADGRHAYWVQSARDFRAWDMEANTEHQIIGTPPTQPYDYTYFPTVSADNRWFLYGASPSQHDHNTGDYEAYIVPLVDMKASGTPVRLTFNTRTDRWPNLWIAPEGSSNPLPDGPYDVASSPASSRPPSLPLFTFLWEDARPELGGEWGLWPQQDGCGGTATFMPYQDAEGGQGGAMKVAYTIKNEPHSFSLWLTSGSRNVDLAAYDHFVLYARGDVPSLTVVVKDHNAGDADARKGVAECVVTGLADQWQRFEVPFAGFVPREEGGSIDWRAIGHVGFAMIAPQNAESGTFWVDNLRTEAGPED